MSAWILAAAVGVVVAALSYLGRAGAATRAAPALVVLRALAAALVAALALDAPAGRARAASPIVVLDASASWTRGADSAAYRAGIDSARAAGGDTLWLVGDSLRAGDPPPIPRDVATRLRPAAERAVGSGRPVVLVTDGEAEDGDALRDAPRGSRVVVVSPARGRDAAVTAVDAPRVAAAGDTAELRVTIAADAGGAGAGTLAIDVGGRTLAPTPLPATPPFGERAVVVRVPLGGAAGATLVRAIAATEGDRDRRNDTATVVVEVSTSPAAVFVSTAPDFDARAVLAVLRGTLSLPARAYVRVAPEAWRAEGTLAAVAEPEVLRTARAASLLVLHGDTSLLGPPRSATRAALALVPSVRAAAAGEGDEWYATAAPPSPIAAALSGVAWDSLPPIDVGAGAPAGEWVGLETRRGRRGDPRAAVTGSEAGRRVVVVGAAGLWRWQFRGGAAGDAFAGLWGGIFDWLAAGRGDERGAVPSGGLVRTGEPVRWRRGGPDTLVRLTLRRRTAAGERAGDVATLDSLTLRFAAASTVAESAPLAAGVYDVRAPGGSAVLAVNAPRELLPRRPAMRSGPAGSAPSADLTPRLRELGWVYAAALALLCAEWLLRRRSGLR